MTEAVSKAPPAINPKIAAVRDDEISMKWLRVNAPYVCRTTLAASLGLSTDALQTLADMEDIELLAPGEQAHQSEIADAFGGALPALAEVSLTTRGTTVRAPTKTPGMSIVRYFLLDEPSKKPKETDMSPCE